MVGRWRACQSCGRVASLEWTISSASHVLLGPPTPVVGRPWGPQYPQSPISSWVLQLLWCSVLGMDNTLMLPCPLGSSISCGVASLEWTISPASHVLLAPPTPPQWLDSQLTFPILEHLFFSSFYFFTLTILFFARVEYIYCSSVFVSFWYILTYLFFFLRYDKII